MPQEALERVDTLIKVIYLYIKQVITLFFSCNLGYISTRKLFKDCKLYSPYGLVQFGYPLKNFLVLIYRKLHSKSRDYVNILASEVKVTFTKKQNCFLY